jgi:hypothetical protein
MLFSPFVIAPVERAQALQEEFVRRRRHGRHQNRLTALVEISIDFAGRSHAAFGRRLEAAAYLLDFLSGQITSASANQYSVLIIHAFSPFIIGSVDGPKLVRLYIGATLAEESISVRAGIRLSRCGAKGCGTYSSTDVLDFLLSQGTSASAKQYSVLVIHILSAFVIGSVARAQALQESLLAALRHSRAR